MTGRVALAQRMQTETAGMSGLRALEAAGIDCLMLKGPVTRRLTGQVDRPSVDTDLLVDPERFEAAIGVLEDAGWALFTSTRSLREAVAKDLHAIELTKGTTGIDLHFRLPTVPMTTWDWCLLWSRRRRLEVLGSEVWTPDDAAGLLHVAITRVTGGPGGRGAGDLRLAIERRPRREDWEPSAQLARMLGIDDVLGAALRLAHPHLGLAEQLGLPAQLTRPALRLLAAGAPSPAITVAEIVALRRRPRSLARRVRMALIPTRSEAALSYPEARDDRPFVLSRAQKVLRASPASLIALIRVAARDADESRLRLPASLRAAVGLRWLLTSASRLMQEVISEVAYRTVEPEKRSELTYAHYVDSRRYRAPAVADPLYDWEAELLGEPPRPGARMLLGAAGAGRELVGFGRRGWRVSAFEPSDLALVCREVAAHQPDAEALRGSYAELIEAHRHGTGPLTPFVDRRYDAVVLGWGSYTHLLDAGERTRLLEVAAALSAPGARLLVSFMTDDLDGRWHRLARAARRRTRPYGHAEVTYSTEMGFLVFLTTGQVLAEAKQAGWDTVLAARSDPFAHVMLTRS